MVRGSDVNVVVSSCAALPGCFVVSPEYFGDDFLHHLTSLRRHCRTEGGSSSAGLTPAKVDMARNLGVPPRIGENDFPLCPGEFGTGAMSVDPVSHAVKEILAEFPESLMPQLISTVEEQDDSTVAERMLEFPDDRFGRIFRKLDLPILQPYDHEGTHGIARRPQRPDLLGVLLKRLRTREHRNRDGGSLPLDCLSLPVEAAGQIEKEPVHEDRLPGPAPSTHRDASHALGSLTAVTLLQPGPH